MTPERRGLRENISSDRDNAPSSATTRELVGKMPGIRYVLEPRPGLDVAK